MARRERLKLNLLYPTDLADIDSASVHAPGCILYNPVSKHRKVPVSDPLPYGDLPGVELHIRAWKPPECVVSDFGASKQRVGGSNPPWDATPSFRA